MILARQRLSSSKVEQRVMVEEEQEPQGKETGRDARKA